MGKRIGSKEKENGKKRKGRQQKVEERHGKRKKLKRKTSEEKVKERHGKRKKLKRKTSEKVVEESAAAKITDKKMNKWEGKWKAKVEERKAKNEKNWQQGKGKWKKV